jgi:hypothetical protein
MAKCAPSLIGEPVEGERYLVHAVLSVAGERAGTSLQQVVACHVGKPRVTRDAVRVHLRWEPLAHERWLPSFDGELVVAAVDDETSLQLRGFYTVPLGPIGRFGDGVAGRRIARRSLADFLGAIARRLAVAAAPAGAVERGVAVREPV